MDYIAVDHEVDRKLQCDQVQILYLFSEALAKRKFSGSSEAGADVGGGTETTPETFKYISQQQALDVLETDVIPLAPSQYSECEARCLVGRIYKDRWKESPGLADTTSLKHAIVFYRMAFTLAQEAVGKSKSRKGDDADKLDIVFPGINLATLLVAYGQDFSFKTNIQLERLLTDGVPPPIREGQGNLHQCSRALPSPHAIQLLLTCAIPMTHHDKVRADP